MDKDIAEQAPVATLSATLAGELARTWDQLGGPHDRDELYGDDEPCQDPLVDRAAVLQQSIANARISTALDAAIAATLLARRLAIEAADPDEPNTCDEATAAAHGIACFLSQLAGADASELLLRKYLPATGSLPTAPEYLLEHAAKELGKDWDHYLAHDVVPCTSFAKNERSRAGKRIDAWEGLLLSYTPSSPRGAAAVALIVIGNISSNCESEANALAAWLMVHAGVTAAELGLAAYVPEGKADIAGCSVEPAASTGAVCVAH